MIKTVLVFGLVSLGGFYLGEILAVVHTGLITGRWLWALLAW